ncbi:MAG: hypothetical protein ACJAQZ_004291 [Planctomycetota bacterium]|jgi:hypothetical protein
MDGIEVSWIVASECAFGRLQLKALLGIVAAMKTELLAGLLTALPLLAQGEPGLRLFAPVALNEVQLVDGQGAIVHTWPGYDNLAVHLTEDGSLLRAVIEPNIGFPGTTGRLQKLDIDGNMTWDMLISNAQRLMHHDIQQLPNGNVLVMVADYLTQADALAAGRDPALLPAIEWLPESILEFQQTGPTTGQVVWEWHVQDHLIQDFDASMANYGVVANHPELVNINYPAHVLQLGDWNHCNGIDYDPINDWFVISAREQNEVWLIDHSTTAAEAAGHTGGARGRGGDLLWRWGNPEAYGRGSPADRQLFKQHSPRFVPQGYPGAGHITIFNNQYLVDQSAIFEIELPLDAQGLPFVDAGTNVYGPAAPLWTFAEPGFYSSFVSSAERLASGNTLICSGAQKRLFEVTPAGQTVWSYTHPTPDVVFHAHAVERRLWASSKEVSVASGGRTEFTHIVDSSHAGNIYYLLGTLSGTTPGTPLPGGLVLPLNQDVLLMGMVIYANIGVFQNTLGNVDAQGNAFSAIDIPPGLLVPAIIGLEMDLCHAIIDGTGYVVEISNLVKVEINP